MDIQLLNLKESFNIDCRTFSHISEIGRKTYKDKKSFETLKEAILECKVFNAKPKQISKVVSYKCKSCHKYHIGRNGTTLTEKYKAKLNAELDKIFGSRRKRNQETERKKIANNSDDMFTLTPNFKVVGKIDLDKVPKK